MSDSQQTQLNASAPVRVIDAHVHFWDPSVLRYSWLDQTAALNRTFHVNDYTPFTDQSVDAVLFVEANCDPEQNEREVAMIERWAESESRIAGTVAHVNLLDVKRREAVLTHLETQDRVVGVRHNIQGHDAGYCTQREFVTGVQHVGETGFVFDVCATTNQLRDVYTLIDRCEQTEFVLDHCGKPDIASNDFVAWAKSIDSIARLANVNCKLSGLLTQASFDGSSDDTQTDAVITKYLSHAIGCFGPERVLYGSDWPVSTQAGSESRWRKIVQELCGRWPIERRQALFANNAIRIYNLSIPYTV